MNETEQFIAEWVDYTRQRLARALALREIELSVGSYDDFVKTSIQQLGEGLIAAHFTYRISGLFVNMGVGRGMSLSDRRLLVDTSQSQQEKRHRVRKQWFSKPFYGRLYWLREAITLQVVDAALSQFPQIPQHPPTLEL